MKRETRIQCRQEWYCDGYTCVLAPDCYTVVVPDDTERDC